jgi:hypothetical protein
LGRVWLKKWLVSWTVRQRPAELYSCLLLEEQGKKGTVCGKAKAPAPKSAGNQCKHSVLRVF